MKVGDGAVWRSPFGSLNVVLRERKLRGWIVDISPLKFDKHKRLFASDEDIQEITHVRDAG